MLKFKYLSILGVVLSIGTLSAQDGGRFFGTGLPKFLEEFDVNQDGRIDEEERQALRDARQSRHQDWIDQWDDDLDGRLSFDELFNARQAIRDAIEAKRAERFAEVAGDDGCLSLEEFAAVPALESLPDERIAALYARMDADGDECVTLSEFNSRLRHHRPPHHPGGGDDGDDSGDDGDDSGDDGDDSGDDGDDSGDDGDDSGDDGDDSGDEDDDSGDEDDDHDGRHHSWPNFHDFLEQFRERMRNHHQGHGDGDDGDDGDDGEGEGGDDGDGDDGEEEEDDDDGRHHGGWPNFGDFFERFRPPHG